MESNGILNWISHQGFAIDVATFLLLRLERKLDTIIEKLDALS